MIVSSRLKSPASGWIQRFVVPSFFFVVCDRVQCMSCALVMLKKRQEKSQKRQKKRQKKRRKHQKKAPEKAGIGPMT